MLFVFIIAFVVFVIAAAAALDEGEPLGFFICLLLASFSAFRFFQETLV